MDIQNIKAKLVLQHNLLDCVRSFYTWYWFM